MTSAQSSSAQFALARSEFNPKPSFGWKFILTNFISICHLFSASQSRLSRTHLYNDITRMIASNIVIDDVTN